jgi:xanthine dehydrogenase YagS FAD-binding subunit
MEAHREPGRPRYLAGGTGLLDLMKLHVETPDHLIDVRNLPLDQVEDRGDSVWTGAAVRNSDMAEHALIRTSFPVVSQALLSGASPQLRNLATLAGNLLQRTRCPYFRDPAWACNKRRPGSGCAAQDGFDRTLAILGGSRQCIATHPSDLCVALAALGARVKVLGPGGERWIAFPDFFFLPGDTPHLEHALAPGDLVLGVEIPKVAWFRRSTYVKVRDRASYAFALVSAAVALELDGAVIRRARVAFGGVGTVPWRSSDAEQALEGRPCTEATARAAAQAALSGARAGRFNGFKAALTEDTLARAVIEAGRIA